MSRSLIHRTGLNVGRVYNLVGDNLTAYPPGAGNSMVGPWAMDFISLLGTTEAEVGVLWDSEFSGIIADGRALDGQGEEPFIFADLDEDEDLTDRRSRISNGSQARSIKINGVWVRLYHTAPRWEDARIWHVDVDGTHPAEPESTLAEWLDENTGMAGDGFWHSGRHALRVPVRWAIYKVMIVDNYESMLDMVAENSLLEITTGDLLGQGPRGMLTALHGALWAADHAVRLYKPSDNLPIVERGMFFMPYDGTIRDNDTTTPRAGRAPISGTLEFSGNSGKAQLEGDLSVALTGDTVLDGNFNTWSATIAPDGTVDPATMTVPTHFDDAVFPVPGGTIDLESSDPEMSGTSTLAATGGATPSAASRNWGTVYTTMVHTRKNVRVTPKMVYVWHLQTCPVRVGIRRDPGNDDLLGHVVIGGLTSPFYGPPVRLVYHEGNAT